MIDPSSPPSLLAPLFSTAEMRAILDDRARLQRMLDFEAALVRAEAAVGIVPSSHVNIITEACRAELFDLRALTEATAITGDPVGPLVDALTTEVGKQSRKAAGYVHWGASSQDVIDTSLVLELRAVLDALSDDIDRATKALITLAGRNRRNMTLARTMLQHALPMPFGLKLAGYAAALSRSRDRLRRLRKEALVLQFGGSAGTLAALDDKGLDVSERLAALLDLATPDGPWHSHRDRLAEIASALAILAGTCGKIARDVALLMQSEVAEVEEPVVPRRPSTATLPNERNPIGAATALSAAMAAPNLAATILNAQLQEHERAVGAWHAEWMTFPALALAVSGTLRAVVTIVEGLGVDVDRMKANLDATGGLVFAEAVAYALSEKLGRTEAHELIAELSRDAVKQKRPFRDVLAANDKIKTQINAADLDKLFRPNHYQGVAQSFIDRLVASSQGRPVRRAVSLEPKMPSAKIDHLAAIGAATSAVRATASPETASYSSPGGSATTAPAPASLAVSPAEPQPSMVEQLARIVEPALKVDLSMRIDPPANFEPPSKVEPKIEPPVSIDPPKAVVPPEPRVDAATPIVTASPVTMPPPVVTASPTIPTPLDPPIEFDLKLTALLSEPLLPPVSAPLPPLTPPLPVPAVEPLPPMAQPTIAIPEPAPVSLTAPEPVQPPAPEPTVVTPPAPAVEPAPAPSPVAAAVPDETKTDDQPGALLEMFARADAEDEQPSSSGGERKSA